MRIRHNPRGFYEAPFNLLRYINGIIIIVMLSVILLIIVVVANIILGAVIIANNPRQKLNIILGLFALLIAIWSLVTYFEVPSLNHSLVELLVGADFTLSVVMGGLFYWFCISITGAKKRFLNLVIAILSLVSLVLAVTGNTVSLEFTSDNVKFIPEIGYWLFSIMLGLDLVCGLAFLVVYRKHNVGRIKSQIGFILYGLAATATILILTNMVLPNILDVSADVTRLGIYGVLFFTVSSAYAIIKHRFMDLRLLVARSVSFTFLLLLLGVVYGLLIFGTATLLFPQSSMNIAQTGVYIILGLLEALTFQPLRRIFERVTDRFFFKNRYDTEQVLSSFSNLLVRELDLDRLGRAALKSITDDLSVAYAQMIIFSNGQLYRTLMHGDTPKRLIVVPQLKHLNKEIIIADDLAGGEVKQILEEHGLRVSLMLKTHDQTIGYLLLGDKLSGSVYSVQDIDVLEIMSHQLAVAVSNSLAFEEIQDFAKTLQERVNHATGRLRVANKHLKELDEAKDEFLSLASHQLRTPLTTIKGYLSMVLEGDAGKITKIQKNYTQYAFDSSERMVRMIADLLDVSRMSAGRFSIQKKSVDIADMLKHEIEQLSGHAKEKGLNLSLVLPHAPIPPIMLDETKTSQVLMNFIDNAIYYTTTGSVTVVLVIKGSMVRVEVRDTGMGVPVADQKHIFSKFYRAQNAQKMRPDGTGLGLFLAKRVIEEQGGNIVFSSKVGQGSVFGFEIPLVSTSENRSGFMHKSIKTRKEE